MKKDIYFVTGNKLKFDIASLYFSNSGANELFNLVQLKIPCPEIQDANVENIALESAKWSYQNSHKPVVKADAGLYIPCLNGFPGPFVRYINQWLSSADLIRLMAEKTNREAIFRDALAFTYKDMSSVFISDTLGTIAENVSASGGSSIDNIFIPENYDKPLSQLTDEEIKTVWNVSRWEELIEYLKKRYDRL